MDLVRRKKTPYPRDLLHSPQGRAACVPAWRPRTWRAVVRLGSTLEPNQGPVLMDWVSQTRHYNILGWIFICGMWGLSCVL